MTVLPNLRPNHRPAMHPRSLVRLAGAVALLVLSASVKAQLDVVTVYGTLKDMSTARKLDGAVVTIYKNGSKLLEVTTNAGGKYEVNLDYGADYKIMCSKPGYVGKNITIDTRNVPEEDRTGGHGMNIDFTLMAEIKGLDYSILLEPFGKAQYVQGSGNFEWDMEYTNRMRDAQARLLKEYQDKLKREANAEADYARLMQQGEAAMTAKDYQKAVSSFTGALELKPADPVATAKLSNARMMLEQLEGVRKLEQEYAALIKEADALFTKKEYEAAKAKYEKALDIKDEAHPKQRIKEIDAILADLAKKAEEERKAKELEDKYKAAITAADAAFNTSKWDQAIAKYTEASALKPAEKYPRDQIAASERKKEEEQKAREIEERYKAAIAAADAAFKAAQWDLAEGKYTEASGLKPTEQYPKDQLAAVARKREEAARKAEEERLARELNEKYQAAITAADAAFNAARYELASEKYNEALGHKPNERYPRDQLAAIQRKLEEIARQEEEARKARELQERYQSAIAAADAAFQAQRWEEAIAKYNEALGLKPAEQYPKDQLAAIRRKQDELARQAEEERRTRELNERYQAAIAAGDAAFDASDWNTARSKYTEAAAIKPGEQYPKDRLALIEQRIAEAAERRKQEEAEARYNATIQAADQLFGIADYAGAKSKYQEALAMKPQERYPKDRIAEADALLAELARKARDERERQEQERRYNELIDRADKAFANEQWTAALTDYKDALKVKPGEAHPTGRIAEIEQRLDEEARAKAEAERLAREKEEQERRYNHLITQGERAFGEKRYEEALDAFNGALEVKPGDPHAERRLQDVRYAMDELARKAEAERLAREREDEELRRRAEEERLAAQRAAEERARLEEEERRRREAEALVETRYREAVAAGDLAFAARDLDRAADRYVEALGIKPHEQYPKDRLAAITAEREAQRRAQEEADRLAEERRLAELERLRREQEEAEARRLAEEQLRAEREAAKALDDRYREIVLQADEALARKSYMLARGLYAQASDVKPTETYPLVKIDQIDKLLADLERQREEAERAAQQRSTERPDTGRPRQGATVDMRKEQEAEAFMRAAREREEAEKYERIRKFRADMDEQERRNAESAQARRDAELRQSERYVERSAGSYEGDESRRSRNAEELEAYRESLARAEADRQRRAAEARDRARQSNLHLLDEADERARAWELDQANRARLAGQFKENVHRTEEQRQTTAQQRSAGAYDAVVRKAGDRQLAEQRGHALTEAGMRQVNDEKRAQQLREARYAQASEMARQRAKEQLDAVTYDRPRAYADHNRSRLAMDYPPGVTEESYTEGNKVIIRRVVVDGDRADEYSKVIAKWGTFYFKNGQSITEAIWMRETE